MLTWYWNRYFRLVAVDHFNNEVELKSETSKTIRRGRIWQQQVLCPLWRWRTVVLRHHAHHDCSSRSGQVPPPNWSCQVQVHPHRLQGIRFHIKCHASFHIEYRSKTIRFTSENLMPAGFSMQHSSNCYLILFNFDKILIQFFHGNGL